MKKRHPGCRWRCKFYLAKRLERTPSFLWARGFPSSSASRSCTRSSNSFVARRRSQGMRNLSLPLTDRYDMIMVTGCHRNKVSCDFFGKFALKITSMQTSDCWHQLWKKTCAGTLVACWGSDEAGSHSQDLAWQPQYHWHGPGIPCCSCSAHVAWRRTSWARFQALGRQDRWINLERLDRCVGCNCVFSIFGRPRYWIHLLLCFFLHFCSSNFLVQNDYCRQIGEIINSEALIVSNLSPYFWKNVDFFGVFIG